MSQLLCPFDNLLEFRHGVTFGLDDVDESRAGVVVHQDEGEPTAERSWYAHRAREVGMDYFEGFGSARLTGREWVAVTFTELASDADDSHWLGTVDRHAVDH
jgi:hypothetical protein